MATIEHDTAGASPPEPPQGPRRRRLGSRGIAGLAGAGLLVAGIVIGGIAGTFAGRHQTSTLVLQPAPIAQMKDDTPVAIKGRVAEIFGNKIIVDDGTGRALVETGRRGEGGDLVAKDQTITAQGRFDDGVIRAEMLVQTDGTVVDLAPPKPPKGPPGHRLADLLDR